MKKIAEMMRLDVYRKTYSVKERIFLLYMIFFSSLAVLTILTNILYGLDFSFNYKWMGLGAFCIAMGIFALKGIRTALIHRIGIYVLAFAILPLSWLASSGLVSPSIIYSTVIMLLINFLLSGKERLVVDLLFLMENLGLISLYRYQRQLFKTMTAEEQFFDWIINVPLVFAFTALLLTVFERAYERERLQSLEKTEKLEVLSKTDSLTGLANRLNLERDIDSLIRNLDMNGTVFSLLLLDVDYFKKYNDAYGHLQGDVCLKMISTILKNSMKDRDGEVYRFGGEEFLISLPGVDGEGAMEFAQRLKGDIAREAIPFENSDISSIITVSMGITFSSDPKTGAVTLLKQADTALYQAKASGRNTIVYCEN